jgi:hypothetical protein
MSEMGMMTKMRRRVAKNFRFFEHVVFCSKIPAFRG